MQEKAMVSDALNSINSGLKTYTDMISQTENMELRNALVQMRNEAEKSQYELYQMAKSKNYYQPSAQANQNEIQSLKSIFSGSTGWSGNQGMTGNMSSMGNMSNTGSMGNKSSDIPVGAGVDMGSTMTAGAGTSTTETMTRG